MRFGAESQWSADNTVGRTQILTRYQGNNKQHFWSLRPSDWPSRTEITDSFCCMMSESGPVNGTEGPYLRPKYSCYRFLKLVPLVYSPTGRQLNMQADEGIKQMSRIALHANKLVGHRNVTIFWWEDVIIGCHFWLQILKMWDWNVPGEYWHLSSKQFPVNSKMLPKQAGKLISTYVNKQSAEIFQSFSQNRREPVWRRCFYPEIAEQTEHFGRMTAVTTLISKTQNKVIVQVQIEEWIPKRLLELLTVTFATDVRIKHQIKEKFCFATEGDVGRVCHSLCHHVKNISSYNIQNFKRL